MGTGGVGTVRFAVITDVHANLPALDAALARIDDAGCDFIVHTGDAIGIGPYPAETLGRMLARPDMRFIMGNHDALFAFGLPSPRPSWFSAEEEAHQRWTHAQLDRGLRESVRQWPYRFTIPVDRSSITFCHYGRKTEQREQEEQDHPDALVASSFASIIRDPGPGDLDRLFAVDESGLVFYGHHHPRSDLTGRARYINPGSTGCSLVGAASFALVSIHPDGVIDVELRQAPYDRAPILAALDEREVPTRGEIRAIFFGVT